MLMKDIEVGEEYAATEWGTLDHVDLFLSYGRPESTPPASVDWVKAWREALRKTSLYAQRVYVIGKGVEVPNYTRPGLLVMRLDRDTGKALDEEPQVKRTVQLAMEWGRFSAIYLDVMSAYEESIEEDRRRREQYKRQERERNAEHWTEREFETAREHLRQMVALGELKSYGEGLVQKLVELRHPEGNPYEGDA